MRFCFRGLSATTGILDCLYVITTPTVTARRVAAFRAVPSVHGSPAEAYWHARADRAQSQSGDVWVAGHAGYGAGARNFGIGANGPGLIMKIEGSSGATAFNFPVSAPGFAVGGQAVITANQLNAQRPHAAGVMDSNGAVVRDNGKYAWSASRQGSNFSVVLTTPCFTPYWVIATAEYTSASAGGGYRIVPYGDRTATGFTRRVLQQLPPSVTFMTRSNHFAPG